MLVLPALPAQPGPCCHRRRELTGARARGAAAESLPLQHPPPPGEDISPGTLPLALCPSLPPLLWHFFNS